MFYGDSVQDTRALFFSSWQKYRLKQPLMPLEQQLVDVMVSHPEYHALLEAKESAIDKNYFPELGQTNPFLHMGFHLAIRDQIRTDRPKGIATVYQQLVRKYTDVLVVEHMLMEPLAECLWQAQRNHSLPNETAFLQACRQLIL